MSRYNYSPARFIIAQVLLYLLLFWWFAEQFRFAFGPDFVSYSSIAKKYAAGDISSAINSWWSPAYSWLLAICSIFSKDPLTANKILQCCMGLPALFLVRGIIFFHSREKKDIYAEWLILAFIPALVFWGLTSDTPDFGSAIVLLWFFFCVLKLLVNFSYRKAFLTGFTGALAYYFKSYNFYFVAAIGVVILIAELIRQRKQNIVKRWIMVAGTFIIFSAIWIAALYGKYNKIMIASIGWHEPCTSKYVLQIKPNAAAADCAPLQFDSANLVSNWETPAHYHVSSINSFLKQENTGQIFLQNTKDFFRSFVSKYQLALLALFLILLWNYWRKNGYLYLAFWAIYCGGYFLFHLEPRFFIMPALLLMIVISISFLRLTETITGKWIHYTALMAIMILFAHSYLYNIRRGMKDEVQFKARIVAMQNHKYLEGKNIATAAGLYDAGMTISFIFHARFFGSLTAPEDDPASIGQLKKNHIDYLLTTDSKGFYGLKQVR